MDKSLLTLGLSAIYNRLVIYESEKKNYSGENFIALEVETFHKRFLQELPTNIEPNITNKREITTNLNSNDTIMIIIKPLNGESFWLQVKESELVKDLKEKIRYKIDIPVRFQTLCYREKKIEDDHLISDYNITYGSTIHMEIRLKGGGGTSFIYFINDSFLSPSYDYDFTSVTDSIVHRRGSEVYTRPCGWMRFALNINKYNTETDGKTWLGQCNGPNEWLVSYHGTNDISCNSIAMEGFQLSKCTRFAYGKGIYSTPSIEIARTYGKTFKKDNCEYVIVLQNRVNPINLIKKDDIQYWISPNDKDIRPYGICIKKV
ncbi:hypothetical protein ACTFIW_013068 [Dictyostelium discoideum]